MGLVNLTYKQAHKSEGAIKLKDMSVQNNAKRNFSQ
jgi:hypothetical protein